MTEDIELKIAKIKEFKEYLQTITEERRGHIMRAKALAAEYKEKRVPEQIAIEHATNLLLDEIETLWAVIIPISEAYLTYFEEMFTIQKAMKDTFLTQSKSPELKKLGSDMTSLMEKFEKVEPLFKHIENAIKKAQESSKSPKEMYG